MRFKACLREMASDEISAMIDGQTLAAVRAKDPHPLFKVFVVGHEGESQGHMVGVGNVVKRWFRESVQQLHDHIVAGLQLFNGHGLTNDHSGRQPIGEVVGKKVMQIGERLSSVVACWIYPEYQHLPLDVASVECQASLDEGAGGLVVANVGNVTGIALGNSRVNKPGFAGATLLGQLQAFAMGRTGDQHMEITLEDVRAFLTQERKRPSDVFAPEDLIADPVIASMREKSPSNYEFARMRRELTDAEKKLADMEREKATLSEKVKTQEAEISAGRLETAKMKVGHLFETQRATRKLEERQIKFIQPRLARFTPQKPEEIEKEFNGWLDKEIDEEAQVAQLYGVAAPKPPANGGGGGEPNQGGPGPAPDPMLDPAQNDFIKLA